MRTFTTVIFIFAVLLVMPIGSFLPAFAFSQSKCNSRNMTCGFTSDELVGLYGANTWHSGNSIFVYLLAQLAD